MVQRVIYDPNGFRNVEKDGKIIGYCFGYKAQYYRGFSPSIVRGVKICVDGEEAPQDAILFTNKGETYAATGYMTWEPIAAGVSIEIHDMEITDSKGTIGKVYFHDTKNYKS